MKFNYPLMRLFYEKYTFIGDDTTRDNLKYKDLTRVANLTKRSVTNYKNFLKNNYSRFKQVVNGREVITTMNYKTTIIDLDNILKYGLVFYTSGQIKKHFYFPPDEEKVLLAKSLEFELERIQKDSKMQQDPVKNKRDIFLLEAFLETIQENMQETIPKNPNLHPQLELNLYDCQQKQQRNL